MPDLKFAITKHPIGGLKPDIVREKADAMLDAVLGGVSTVQTSAAADGS